MFIDLKPRLNTIGTKPVERYTNVWRFKCVCFIRFRLVEFAKYNLQWAYCIKNESALSHPLSDQMTGKHDQITEVEYLHEEDFFQFPSKSSFFFSFMAYVIGKAFHADGVANDSAFSPNCIADVAELSTQSLVQWIEGTEWAKDQQTANNPHLANLTWCEPHLRWWKTSWSAAAAASGAAVGGSQWASTCNLLEVRPLITRIRNFWGVRFMSH